MRENQETKPNGIAAWEYTLRASVEPPVYAGKIIDRFLRASPDPLTLFIPWGASRAKTRANDQDKAALRLVEQYSRMLLSYGIPNETLIMPVDVYAIEINDDDQARVAQYFLAIGAEAESLGFSVDPWSAIRERNRELYESTIRWECSPEALWRSTPKALWYDSLLPASLARHANRGEDKALQSAFRYLQERIAEARVIDAVYQPLKLSMGSKQKDDIVDRELPRVYLLEKNLRFPWLKGE